MEITGYFRKEIYYNETNDYLVGLVEIKHSDSLLKELFRKNTITITGYLPRLINNELYHFTGDITKNNYGMQFQVTTYELDKKNDEKSLIEFFSGPLFKGVGKKTASKIVALLGKDAIDKILADNSVLDNFKLKEVTKKLIVDVLVNNYEVEKVILFLIRNGFGSKLANSIYKEYGSNTIKLLEENPYRLVDDITGIGFKKADTLALSLNFNLKSPFRVQAAIKYLFQERCFNEGFTYLTHEQVYNDLLKFMDDSNISLTNEDFNANLQELLDKQGLIKDENKLFIPVLYEAELTIASRIKALIEDEEEELPPIDEMIDKIEREINIRYTKRQKEAITTALTNKVSIITGGPGTGKTTVVKGVLKAYSKLFKNNGIALVAPTGRAAKRLNETTGMDARTIHRLLGFQITGAFTYDETNKLNCNLLICDESSMIDCVLAANLLRALSNKCRIIFVGDINQLPSVGPGEFLKDLINSKLIPTVKLDVIHRQSNDSSIIKLAHEINSGIIAEDILLKQTDRNFIRCDNSQILENLNFIVTNAFSKEFNLENTQVLAPMYKSPVGIDSINSYLQERFNPKSTEKREVTAFNKTYRVNDKVIQLVNRPVDNVMNGDIGYIETIYEDDNDETTLSVNFDGNLVKYSVEDLSDLSLAYCISIHKSQGSEFDIVVVVLSKSYSIMLRRKLLYTAVTRAKKFLILLGDVNAYRIAVSNTNETKRQTSLLNRLEILQSNILKIDDFEFQIVKQTVTPYDFLD